MMAQLYGTRSHGGLRLERGAPILYYRGSRKGGSNDRFSREEQKEACCREPQPPIVVRSLNCLTCPTGLCAVRTTVGTSIERSCSSRSRR